MGSLDRKQPDSPGLFAGIFKFIKKIVLLAGLFLTVMAVVELIRIYNTLRAFHIYAAYAGSAVFAAAVLGIGYFIVSLMVTPVMYRPFAEVEPEDFKSTKKYCRYLLKIMRHLSKNTEITEASASGLRAEIAELKTKLKSETRTDSLKKIISDLETNTIEPVLKQLDNKADKFIQDSVRDIMLGVALSPYHAVDLLIVLYRNSVMIYKIAGIYNNRPGLRELTVIFTNIFGVVATVNYLNVASKAIESVFKNIPVVGPFIDDILQGIGAGYMTSIVGSSAKLRCRAFRNWHKERTKLQAVKDIQSFINLNRNIINDLVKKRAPAFLKPLFKSEDKWYQLQGQRYSISYEDVQLNFNCLSMIISKEIEAEQDPVRRAAKQAFLDNFFMEIGVDCHNEAKIMEGLNGLKEDTVKSLFITELFFRLQEVMCHKQFSSLKFDKEKLYAGLEEYADILDRRQGMVDTLKKALKTVQNSHIPLLLRAVSIAAPAICFGIIGNILAPGVGGAIGAAMGYSGVVASNVGLAFLGGGSLAAGGFGMAGGTMLLTAVSCFSGGCAGAGVTKFLTDAKKAIYSVTIKDQVIIKVVLLDEFGDFKQARKIIEDQKIELAGFQKEMGISLADKSENQSKTKIFKEIIKVIETAIKWEEKQIAKAEEQEAAT